ncbi:MAG: hypothetical protein KY475_04475 [Planctomycetes bacterium]|nr:hypothetical protein [Planctomycetota bacterium]
MAARYAGVLGLVAFLASIARGAIDGQGLAATPSACFALAVFAAIGAIAGKIAQTAVEESVHQNMKAEIEAFENAAAEGAALQETTPASSQGAW